MTVELEDLLQGSKVNLEIGLTEAEVTASRTQYGSNALTPPPSRPLILQFLDKFKDQTIILLSVCAVIAIGLGVFVEHKFPFDGVGILAAVFIATGVAFYSELKSNKAFELLKAEADKIHPKALRDGQPVIIPLDEVVKGDVLLLEQGNKIPADAYVLKYSNLTVNEAAMTGEDLAVTKHQGDLIRRGTLVETGSATVVVVAVGDNTELGKINKELSATEEEETELQKQLGELAGLISKFGTGAAVLIFLAQIARAFVLTALNQPLTLADGASYTLGDAETFSAIVQFVTVAVAIVVVAVPEGLPLAVVVSLSLSAQRITKDNSLVRKLVAVENAGSATVICSDKTGTLTQNRQTVESLYLCNQVHEGPTLHKLTTHPTFPLLKLSVICNTSADLVTHPKAASKEQELVIEGNQLEGALLEFIGSQTGNLQEYQTLRKQHPPLRVFEFNSAEKTMTTIIHDPQNPDQALVMVKGAPEKVWELCNFVETSAGSSPIKDYSTQLKQQMDAMSQRAMRTVAVAYKYIPIKGIDNEAERSLFDSNLTALALFGFSDPLRPDVKEAIEQCHHASVRVMMMTGDNRYTAEAIARQLNLIQDDSIQMTSDEFNKYSDEELKKLLPRLSVLSRSVPKDKHRLVSLLQEQGEIVAVTGDGTNDSPALKKADLGISMGIRGTDIAKEASDIILLDDNFKSIVRAINWGRGLYENIQKFLQFQLTVNVTALAVVFIGTLAGFTLPLTPIQLLWVNLIMDTLAVIALSLEPPRPGLLEEKPRGRGESIIKSSMRFNIVVMSIYFTISLLLLLWWFFSSGGEIDRTELSIIFSVFVMFQLFNEINCRSVDAKVSPLAGILKSKSFMGVFGSTVIIQILLVQVDGPIGDFFRTSPLDLTTWALIIAFGSSALVLGEIGRFIRKSRLQTTPQA